MKSLVICLLTLQRNEDFSDRIDGVRAQSSPPQAVAAVRRIILDTHPGS